MFVLLLSFQAGSYVRSFPLLAALDQDRDGVISASEISGAPGTLRSLDSDGDGKLSPEECGLGGISAALRRQADETVKSLLAFDRNGDGKLTRSEVPERMQGIFERGDLDHDGVMTGDEMRQMAIAEARKRNGEPEQDPAWVRRTATVSMRLMPVLAALDANHDGEISAREIDGADAALKTLDANGDGKLTEDEVRPDPVTGLLARAFLAFDTDGDFRISLAEMSVPEATGLREILTSADRDKDGFVSIAELRAEVTRRADLNHDGVVTKEEMQQASQSGVFGPSGVK